VTDWQVVWLGVIGVSVAVMMIIQVAAIVAGIMLARQLTASIQELRKEIRPLAEKVNRVADEAVRVSSLATVQMERVDRLLATTTSRVEETVTIVQNALGGPVRQGAAAIMAIRAVMSAFRDWQSSKAAKGAHREEEDALFVG
jgi:hypothetical protein